MDTKTLSLKNIGESLCRKFLLFYEEISDGKPMAAPARAEEAVMPEALAIALVEHGYEDKDLNDPDEIRAALIKTRGRTEELASRFAHMIQLRQKMVTEEWRLKTLPDGGDQVECALLNARRAKELLEETQWLHTLLKIDDELSRLVSEVFRLFDKAIAVKTAKEAGRN